MAGERVRKLQDMPMMDWFNNLSEIGKIAAVTIGVTVGLAVIKGLFELFKWFFKKNEASSIQETKIHQEGTDHTAIVTEGDGATVAGRDVNTGIDGDSALNAIIKISGEKGLSENENKHLKEKNRPEATGIGHKNLTLITQIFTDYKVKSSSTRL